MRTRRLRGVLPPVAVISVSLIVVAFVAFAAPVFPRTSAVAGTPEPRTEAPSPAAPTSSADVTRLPDPTDAEPWLSIVEVAPGPGPTRVPLSVPVVTAATWDLAWHIPVLTYHLIATPAEAGDALPSLVVSPQLFDDQLRTLQAAGWRTITAATLASDRATGRRPPARTFVITIDDGHADGWTEAFPILQRHGFVATFYAITGRVGLSDAAGGYMTRDQLLALAAAGMEIGDHSVDHVPLASQTPGKALAEMAGASDWISALVGARPTTLAYPFGSFSQSVVDDAAGLGFSMAFTTIGGCSESPANRLAVPRFHVGPSTSPLRLLSMVRGCG